MNIRSMAFWTMDYLYGSPVKKNVKKVNYDMDTGRVDESQLGNILNYAIKNVPFYSEFKSMQLQDFPIMNKPKYLKEYSKIMSPYFQEKELYKYATSGSSGTPFYGFQDRKKREKHTADLIYFHRKCGWNIGEKYLFLRAWVGSYNNSRVHNFKNNVIPFNVIDLDREMLCSIVALLKNDKSIKMILGYGSALNQLADFLEENKVYINHIKVVISDSDPISKEKRELLSKHLACKIVDRYSNEEHGLIAFSYNIMEPYQVNYSSYLVEILKLDSDDYAEKGEIGRVVITDLYNQAMPLIRYDIGDLAISDDDNRCGVTTIRELHGRTSDMIIQKSGKKVSSASINNYMENMIGIERYQLVQNSITDFTLFVVDNEYSYSDEEFYQCLKACTGTDASIKIVRRKALNADKNGKFRTFISKIDKKEDVTK